jgi:hypothetical protein
MTLRRFSADGGTLFYLATVRCSVSASALMNDPSLCELAAEDAAWRATLDDLDRQAPMFWQWRKRSTWNAERAVLLGVRDELRQRARSLGLPVHAGR